MKNYKNPKSELPNMTYFKQYPAPMFEAMFNLHVSDINSTTPYYGPLLYWLCRCANALNVLEIGIFQGWSSFFMASAVKDEGVRQGTPTMYYAVDVSDCSILIKNMLERDLPVKFIQKDSLELKPSDWDNKTLDLVFQDGWHSTEYVLAELKILLPFLKDKGYGYWVMHDAYGYCEEAVEEIKKLHPNWELTRFSQNYGLAIFRNMDNYDYKQKRWPTGPQKPAFPNKNKIII